jgi:AcrR family transcriptional regulator
VDPSSARPRAPTGSRVVRHTRRRIASATLELLEEGVLRPTAAQVAARAGVGRRTVFRHYQDLGALFAEVVRLNVMRHQELWQPIEAEGAREERVRALVRQRRRLFEAVRPVRRSAASLENRFPVVSELLGGGVRVNREQLEALLAPELEGAAPGLVEALDAVASYEFWDRLRTRQRLGPRQAAAVLEQTLLAVLRGGAG